MAAGLEHLGRSLISKSVPALLSSVFEIRDSSPQALSWPLGRCSRAGEPV